MKLFTEKQVKEAMFLYKAPIRPLVQQVLDQLTPIELPSNEEIEEASPYIPNDSKIDYLSHQEGFVKGAKWMKEQILNQNL